MILVDRPAKLVKGGSMKKGIGLVQLKTIRGEPIEHMDFALRPVSQSLVIKLPFGGYVWNRPVAIEVHESGKSRRIPIVDVTLLTQISLLFSSIATVGIVHLINRRVKSHK